MSRNNSWRLIIIIAVLLFSLNEIFFRDYRFVPPKGRDLVEYFHERARVAPTETTFSNIVFTARATAKDQRGPGVCQPASRHRHERHPALLPVSMRGMNRPRRPTS